MDSAIFRSSRMNTSCHSLECSNSYRRVRIHTSTHRPPAMQQKNDPYRPTPFLSSPSIIHRNPQLSFLSPLKAGGDIVEVEELKGIRVIENEENDPDKPPLLQYLVKWKDGSPDTWEPAKNLADDLLRAYEQKWWSAVKKGDLDTIYSMMEVGGTVLARTVDENYRTAMFFAAALGKAELVDRLVKEGAEVNMADKEGYTALHMAAGYMHVSTINALLAGGADPEQEDRQGRSPLELVESLRNNLPPNNPSLVPRIMALEEVIKTLTENLFEDVEPAQVLDVRAAKLAEDAPVGTPPPTGREFLVLFGDDMDNPVWLNERYISEDVIEDFESGLEYAEAEEILDVRNRGDSRTYLVRWKDGYPDTWEDEEHCSSDLVRIFEEGRSKGGGAVEMEGGQLQLQSA
jgi:signal recognition particle 43 kDa protein